MLDLVLPQILELHAIICKLAARSPYIDEFLKVIMYLPLYSSGDFLILLFN